MCLDHIMTMQKRPFLDFYEREQIIPTAQAIEDELNYKRQREHLFRLLGVPLRWLEHKDIFELGPGNGQKAEFMLKYRPATYIALDANPSSLAQTQERLSNTSTTTEIEIINCDFKDYTNSREFDLVIAEAVIPTQYQPGEFLRRLLRMLAPGGILVFTCMDQMSLLSEVLRRAIAKQLLDVHMTIQGQARYLAEFFQADLRTLEGMTRLPEDWAIDQLIHPWLGPPLDIPTALAELGPDAAFVGSSPSFFQDWRWYKSPDVSVTNRQIVAEAFWSNAHNLVDKRLVLPARDPALNRALFAAASKVYEFVMFQETHSPRQLAPLIEEVMELLPTDSLPTRESLRAFQQFGTTLKPQDLEHMRPWWGRGQQYVSVTLLEQ